MLIIKDIHTIHNILSNNNYDIEHFIKLIFNSNSNIFDVINTNELKLKNKIDELINNTPKYILDYKL